MRAIWLGSIEAALCFAGFFAIFVLSGLTSKIGLGFLPVPAIPDELRLHLTLAEAILLGSTVYHAGVVTAQAGNALACRSEHVRSSFLGWLSNRYLIGGILIELFGIICIIYIPILAKIFKHMAIPLWMWIGLGSYALIIYSIEWVRKSIVRKINTRRKELETHPNIQEAEQ